MFMPGIVVQDFQRKLVVYFIFPRFRRMILHVLRTRYVVRRSKRKRRGVPKTSEHKASSVANGGVKIETPGRHQQTQALDYISRFSVPRTTRPWPCLCMWACVLSPVYYEQYTHFGIACLNCYLEKDSFVPLSRRHSTRFFFSR